MESASLPAGRAPAVFERHRRELTAYCYRMLGSPFDAEDAVQDTLLRAWRAAEGFEGRSQVKTWLYRIATNVCLDMVQGRERRARPMDLSGPSSFDGELSQLPEIAWLEPMPDSLVTPPEDPADVAESRETLRLAFVAALQHLLPRQRAVLILCEVLRWKAAEAAELLETSTASVNSALQRARATLDALDIEAPDVGRDAPDPDLLERYMDAFSRYDMDALTELIRDDAMQSMPPYELWLRGRDDILAFWQGPGHGCRGSKLFPLETTNGSPAFGQYKPDPEGEGYVPWAVQVLELDERGIVELTFFLGTERLFPLYGLPPRLDADGRPAG